MADEDKTKAAGTGPSAGAPSPTPKHSADGTDGKGDSGDKSPAKASKSGGGGSSSTSGAELDQRRMGLGTGGVTEAQADELIGLGVNPNLDNRVGRQRPHTGEFAPKPQQFPGPEVGHFAEHAEKEGDAFEEMLASGRGDQVGSRAEGPHGRGDEDTEV